MKVLVAMDSFKGSLSSIEAGNAVKEAVKEVNPHTQVTVLPLADGGEGTVSSLHFALGGEKVKISVSGPLGQKTDAEYLILKDTNTAVMEMAAAAGITLVPQKEKNILNATTLGVGEMIADAVKRGCRRFVFGIGGSATNDGGAGMLSSLGFEFKDKNGNPISAGAKGLKDLYKIENDNVLPGLADCEFTVACDVNNPLCGKNGCSAVYGPQKGATKENIPLMDGWLKNFAEKAKEINPGANPDFPGAGAAGGLGFAFSTFLNSKLMPGIEMVLGEMNFEEKVQSADIVVTGEGCLDEQSAMGKAPVGVAGIAKKYGKKVIAFSGCIGKNAAVCNKCGIDAYFPILQGVTTLEEALNTDNAYKNLKSTAYQVFRLIEGLPGVSQM